MKSFALDSTDEDGLVFAVGNGDNNAYIAVWRKNSTAPVNNASVFLPNGPGRWHVAPMNIGGLTEADVIRITLALG